MNQSPTECVHEKLDVHKSVQYTAIYNHKTQMARLDEGPVIDWDATCQECGAEVTTGYWNDEPKGMYDIRG